MDCKEGTLKVYISIYQVFFMVGTLIMFMTACGNKEELTEPHFMWDEILYIATYEPIKEEQLREKLGVIKTEAASVVGENGEAKGLPEGTNLFNMVHEKEESPDILAYQIGNRYYIARKVFVHQ
ncbi:hypothetical protein LCL98_20115 [Rossellomorea aquimaris]|nr:hypothetical protein [Rossellomorea aquimaris]